MAKQASVYCVSLPEVHGSRGTRGEAERRRREQLAILRSSLPTSPQLTPSLPCSPSYPASSPPSRGAPLRPRPARSSPDPVSQPLPRSLPSGSSSAPTLPRQGSPTRLSSRGSSRSSPASRRLTLPRCAPVLLPVGTTRVPVEPSKLTVDCRVRAGLPYRLLHD